MIRMVRIYLIFMSTLRHRFHPDHTLRPQPIALETLGKMDEAFKEFRIAFFVDVDLRCIGSFLRQSVMFIAVKLRQ